MLVIENLDGATVERAAALVAREQAAARQVRPELPAGFESAEVCAAALECLPAGMPACRPKASPSNRTSPTRPGSSPRPSGISRRR